VPARLVDVGEKDEEMRLVSADDTTEGSPYMTLSHRWGSVGAHAAHSLTSARLEGYAQSIPHGSLPKTFVEACSLTRALGQRYLWIDSLCIVQDSREDWSEQSAQMWQIYSNSYLNISAAASASPAEGLFRRRDENSLGACVIHVPDEHPELPAGHHRLYSEEHWTRGVEAAPVNSRAWVLQERLLAPRIVHFGQSEVFWECHCLRASETYPQGMLPLVETKDPVPIKRVVEDDSDGKVPYFSLLKTWDAVVGRYSALNLSFASDKLVALSALAEQISVTYPSSGKYLAGLWEAALLSQLLWVSGRPGTATRAETYRAPSWSWACIDGPITPCFDFSGYEPTGDKSTCRPTMQILGASTTSRPGEPYGSAVSGELLVAGCLLKVRLQQRTERPRRKQRSAQEQLESFRKTMMGMGQDYAGEITLSANMTPGGRQMFVGVDVQNGVLFTQGDSDWFDADSYAPKACVGELKLPVMLDTEDNVAALCDEDLFLLPVSCISKNDKGYDDEGYEILRLGCLLLGLEEVDGKLTGRYRRVGACSMEDGPVSRLFCELGNQDEDIRHEGDCEEPLLVAEVVPKTWPYKDLDFMPKEFKRVKLIIV
jgi:hypothetical protein